MSSLNRPVLVLNKMWIPIRIASVKRCLKLVFADKASIVDPKNYSVHNWEEWIKFDAAEDEYGIQTANVRLKVPEVVVLLRYDKIYIKDLRLTKRNIFTRDKYICQYTGRQVPHRDADIDHVIPRSKGGRNTWENLVVCTREINRQKADRTPEEAGLKLIKQPTKPQENHLLIDPRMDIPDSWGKFLKSNK